LIKLFYQVNRSWSDENGQGENADLQMLIGQHPEPNQQIRG